MQTINRNRRSLLKTATGLVLAPTLVEPFRKPQCQGMNASGSTPHGADVAVREPTTDDANDCESLVA